MDTPPTANSLISRMEDFHEVWSDGFIGDSMTVAARLADYNIGSMQTAKQIMRSPTLLREAMKRADAIAEAQEFEACGLKCRIEHVGKSRLDAVDDATIISALTANGVWPLDRVFTDCNAKAILHVAENEVAEPICLDTETEEGFYVFLACLRDLVRRSMILPSHAYT